MKEKLLLKMPLAELAAIADKTRRNYARAGLELCSIINAKSGLCGEDCKFCAQSLRHSAGVPAYALKKETEIIKAAKRAKDMGASKFGIVTSGRSVTREELKKIRGAISKIKNKVGIKVCVSLGNLGEEALQLLKKAGLSRYHHNIETSPKFFSKIVTTHTFQDRINTIKAAKKAGLEVCSGGIIGMGESWQDRIDMALILKKLNVNSVPINILVPIKGTPLGSLDAMSSADAIRTICIFRLVLKDKTIKIAAGRETALKDFQAMAFMAGANGMLIGGYLTIKGRDVAEDKNLIREIEKI